MKKRNKFVFLFAFVLVAALLATGIASALDFTPFDWTEDARWVVMQPSCQGVDCWPQIMPMTVGGSDEFVGLGKFGVGYKIGDKTFRSQDCENFAPKFEEFVVVAKQVSPGEVNVKSFCVTDPLPTPAPTQQPCNPGPPDWQTCP